VTLKDVVVTFVVAMVTSPLAESTHFADTS
jgi:hypothetical protein